MPPRGETGAGVLRWLAEAALRLYPKAWRERYGDEVGDLVAARPVRPRTVADLLAGAADAWLHHLAWLAVAVLLVLGQASPASVTPVAAGALIGVSMTALVAGRTLARGRTGAVDIPSLSGTTV